MHERIGRLFIINGEMSCEKIFNEIRRSFDMIYSISFLNFLKKITQTKTIATANQLNYDHRKK